MGLNKFPLNDFDVYFGAVPDITTFELLEKLGIYAIWNLAAELKYFSMIEEHYVDVVINGDIADFSIPKDVEAFLNQLNEIAILLKSGKKVFVHCFSGIGRSGMILAALKMFIDKASAIQALQLAELHTGGPETEIQKEFVMLLERYNVCSIFRG